MGNYCNQCNGNQKIRDMNMPFWKFWIKIKCPACNGTGDAMPQKKPEGWPPLPPPHGNQKEIDYLQSMQKLDIRNGDIIVLNCPGRLSEEAAARLRSFFRPILDECGFKNTKIVVLEEDIKIGILRKDGK